MPEKLIENLRHLHGNLSLLSFFLWASSNFLEKVLEIHTLFKIGLSYGYNILCSICWICQVEKIYFVHILSLFSMEVLILHILENGPEFIM